MKLTVFFFVLNIVFAAWMFAYGAFPWLSLLNAFAAGALSGLIVLKAGERA